MKIRGFLTPYAFFITLLTCHSVFTSVIPTILCNSCLVSQCVKCLHSQKDSQIFLQGKANSFSFCLPLLLLYLIFHSKRKKKDRLLQPLYLASYRSLRDSVQCIWWTGSQCPLHHLLGAFLDCRDRKSKTNKQQQTLHFSVSPAVRIQESKIQPIRCTCMRFGRLCFCSS